MIPPRKSSARAAPNSKQRLSRWFLFFALMHGTVLHSHGEVGLDYSPLFTLDTAYVVSVGENSSPSFTLDTRYGLGVRSNQSGLFILDTRLSANTGIGASLDFTLDTRDAVIANVLITGRVTDSSGNGLSGATVQALFFNRLQTSAITDSSGNYALPLLPAGTYELRASKANYLTGIQTFPVTANQTWTLNFPLAPLPAPPVVQSTSREPEAKQTPTFSIPSSTQLKVFAGGSFQNGLPIYPNKMTIVLTHGWNSNPNVWAKTMAENLITAGVDANILAWDWHGNAASVEPLGPSYLTPSQGRLLGVSLYLTLHADYAKPIHFIGHSFGTLVNAAAVNYLHGDIPDKTANPAPWSPLRTHVTLLDEAENGADITAWLLSVKKFITPVPFRKRWADNYYTIFGSYHPDAVNIFLGRVAYQYPLDAALGYYHWHSYPHQWYSRTINNVNPALIDHHYSFERMNEQPNFPTPSPFAEGFAVIQDPSPFSSEFSLIAPLNVEEGIKGVTQNVKAFTVKTYQGTIKFVKGTASKVGNVLGSIKEKIIESVSTGSNNPNLVGPIFAIEAFNTPSVGFDLQTGAAPAPPDGIARDGDPTNSPAYVWLNVTVPTNATTMEFDFSVSGDGANDFIAAGINGTNVFHIEARFLFEDAILGSGPIDVSSYGGQDIELFFGIMGGTSTNAGLMVDGIRFYSDLPALQANISDNQFVLSWPVNATNYVLEITSGLGGSNNWAVVTNVPSLIDFQNTVTNAVSAGNTFYRLRKL